jgi:hypothetical protein
MICHQMHFHAHTVFSVQEVNAVDEQNCLQFFSYFSELAMSDEVPIYVNDSVSKH